MNLLGLELSDVGIMVAAAEPAGLLVVDGHDTESPGYALPEKDRLTVGGAARKQAHLYPRQVIDRFWDQLNTEPLAQPNPYAENNAEVAYEHLAGIWKTVSRYGNEMVIAVPGFMRREHMGLILGITRELSIPVRCFVPQGVVATPDHVPEGLLLHLDIHLHRAEVTCLKREDRLTLQDAQSVEGCGTSGLFKTWVSAIAEEFVRSTRFDPFHQAASEQELYDRLPVVLRRLQDNPSVEFEMTGGAKTYGITLTRDLFIQKSVPILEAFIQLIDRMQEQYGQNKSAVILQLTHRLILLPGIKEMLVAENDRQVIELERGAGALGALRFWDPSAHEKIGRSAPFLTSRSLQRVNPVPPSSPESRFDQVIRPTHLLYRNIAYPITDKPLFIGRKRSSDGYDLKISHDTDISLRHCSVRIRGNNVVLNDCSTSGIFVDEARVSGDVNVQLGQTIRVGTPGETLQLIACRDMDERQKSNDI